MYKGRKIIALVPAYNEEGAIRQVVVRTDLRLVDTLLVIDDGSTDATAAVARAGGATVLSCGTRRGVGAALRYGMEYARRASFDIAVIMAGNNKDNPTEIPRLLDPICDRDFDFVMGSRFLPGGRSGGVVRGGGGAREADRRQRGGQGAHPRVGGPRRPYR